MRTLAVMSQKGGAGKTTIAVHLAVTAGDGVRVLDTDPQGSASAVWATNRRKSQQLAEPKVDAVEVRHLHTALDQARSEGAKLAIIDTAPNAGPDAVDVAKLADLVLIPVRPSMLDIRAAKRTVDIVKDAGVPAMLVLSACPLRAPEIAMAREALAKWGLPIAKTEIGDRRPFARAIQTGRAVCEFEAGGKADEEIRALLREVY